MRETVYRLFVLYGLFGLVPVIFSKILEVRGTEKMKKIQKNAVRFDNLKQDFLDDKKYSGTAAREATVCEMQMQDISFDDRTITFRHLKNKHVQLLPMSEALASCLKEYRLGHLYRSLAVSFSEPTPL